MMGNDSKPLALGAGTAVDNYTVGVSVPQGSPLPNRGTPVISRLLHPILGPHPSQVPAIIWLLFRAHLCYSVLL